LLWGFIIEITIVSGILTIACDEKLLNKVSTPIFLGSKTSHSFFTALLFYEEWNRDIWEMGFHFQPERRKYTSRIREDSSDRTRLHNVCGYTCLYVSTSRPASKNMEWDSCNSFRTNNMGTATPQRVSRRFSKLTSSFICLLCCCRIAWWWPKFSAETCHIYEE